MFVVRMLFQKLLFIDGLMNLKLGEQLLNLNLARDDQRIPFHRKI